ncbi:MAG: beta-galactosidase, partial [Geobacteraceae bacterium]|nr:beta-galactosidase [Geobacteraceae bacterium]
MTKNKRKYLAFLTVLLVIAAAMSVMVCSRLNANEYRRSDVIPISYFGLHFHRMGSETKWPDIRFGSWRLWDAYVAWPNLEPAKGAWNFELLDNYVRIAGSNSVEIVLPLGLSPTWASARPYEKSAYRPGNAAEPADLADWENYVRMVADRYKGRIKFYEIWNEPNLSQFYSGTLERYIEMNRIAWQVIKSIDPTAQIVAPSCTAFDARLKWFEQYLAAGGAAYADIIDYHFYVRPAPPEAMLERIDCIRGLMRKYSVNKPLWNTEAGWNISELASNDTVSDDTGAAYVLRAYIVNWAAGVDRFFWYAWDNYKMGLVKTDGATFRPGAFAYATTVKWLGGA